MISVRYTMETTCGDDADRQYYYAVQGRIAHVSGESRRMLIGHIELVYFDLGRMRTYGQNVLDIADEDGGNMHIFEQLCTPSGELQPTVKSIIGEPSFNSNILLIHRLEILPRYRGRGYGQLSIAHAIEVVGRGCGTVALKTFPLQLDAGTTSTPSWYARMGMGHYSPDATIAKKRLRRHYARMGFRSVPHTDIMVLNTEVTSAVVA